jgi:uncharacterized protein YbaR (Trm112 family)
MMLRIFCPKCKHKHSLFIVDLIVGLIVCKACNTKYMVTEVEG